MLARAAAPLLAFACALACSCSPATLERGTPPASEGEASGPEARWRYDLTIDDQLERMHLALCIEGPHPKRLRASDDAIDFVLSARTRDGDPLARQGDELVIDNLGEHPCVDLELDLGAIANQPGRNATQLGDTMMFTPTQWLWHPALIPDDLDASLRLHLPEGVHMTAPWPIEPTPIEPTSTGELRRLERSAFTWEAWVALGRYQPITFEAAGAHFEVAVLDGDHSTTPAGIRAWISTAAESSAQLYDRFQRDRVAVVVIPSSGWGSSAVHFGMARRGGGASTLLILDPAATDERLPGEWVAVHEFLHFGVPLVRDAWLAEGFVTYYQEVVRARAEVMTQAEPRAGESIVDQQARLALTKLRDGFERGGGGARSLARASEVMRQQGTYQRVYWGGCAIAMDLDLQLRRASANRRSLDDLMRRLLVHATEPRRWSADEVLEIFEAETAAWYAAGELDREISPRAIAQVHLEARSIPDEIAHLEGLAIDASGPELRLLDQPADEAALRRAIFARRTISMPQHANSARLDL